MSSMTMSSSPNVTLPKPRRNLEYAIPTGAHPATNRRRRAASTAMALLRLRQHRPYLGHSRTMSGQHAVLHTVEVTSVDRRHEAACDEAEDDAR